MKDARVAIFRTTLVGLIESLDATIRVKGWADAERVPEPLEESASRLLSRLGTADRLAASNFMGSAADAARVNTMLGAMRRLDAAYVSYRRGLEGDPGERENALTTLRAEIEEVKANAL
jgi:hypothetical protein